MEDTGGSSSQTQLPLLSIATNDVSNGNAPFASRSGDSRRGIKQFLFGNLDGSYFFKPLSIYQKKSTEVPQLRFLGITDDVPLLLHILIGLQHLGAISGPVLVPAFFISLSFPYNNFGQYIIQSAFIISGLGSLLQCMRIKIPGTPYHIGTGMSSFVGNSLVFGTMYIKLVGKIAVDDGISIEDAYGKVLGTTAICSVAYLGLTLIPPKYIKVLFPPVVTGCILILIGLDVTLRGFQYWGGGTDCVVSPLYPCQLNGNVHLSFGSPEYIGFGFMVVAILLFTHFYGTAFMRQNSVAVSVLIPYIVSMIVTRDGKHYVTGDYMEKAKTFNFLWTETYTLGVHKSAVLPVLGAFLVTYLHATAVLTSNLEESKLDVTGTDASARIQGGLIGTAVVSLFSVLATGIPVMPIPQNNSVIATTKVASRMTGIIGAIFVLLSGIFGHLLALTLEMPIIFKGGITVPLAIMISLSGLRMLIKETWNERTSTILLYSLVFGLGNLLVKDFVDFRLWPLGEDPNDLVHSLQFAIISMMRAPYFLGGFAAVTLHLMLPDAN